MAKEFIENIEVEEVNTTDVEVVETEKVGVFKKAKNAVVTWANTPKTPIENAKALTKFVLGVGAAATVAFGAVKIFGSNQNDDSGITVIDLNDPDSYSELLDNDVEE